MPSAIIEGNYPPRGDMQQRKEVAMARVNMPGLHTPAVGFDQPFEMLEACHERMLRSLDLLQKLVRHVAQQGGDTSAQQAARDVVRYFDVAAPLHHEDEERHIFPALLTPGSDARLQATVRHLQAEHVHMTALWQRIRPPLQALAQGEPHQPVFSAADAAQMAEFVRIYEQHLQQEEGLIYPAARQHTPADALPAMGQEMAARRHV